MAATRTQVYLSKEQRRQLDERARRERRPLAALVREALDLYLAVNEADQQAILDQTFGALPDLEVKDRGDWDRGRRPG